MMRADIRRCRRCKRKRLDDEPLEVKQYKTCAKCRIIERNKKNSRKPLAEETMLYGLKQFREQASTENYIEEEGLLKDEFFKRYHNKPFNYQAEIEKVLNNPNYVPPVILNNTSETLIPNESTSPGPKYQMTLRSVDSIPSSSMTTRTPKKKHEYQPSHHQPPPPITQPMASNFNTPTTRLSNESSRLANRPPQPQFNYQKLSNFYTPSINSQKEETDLFEELSKLGNKESNKIGSNPYLLDNVYDDFQKYLYEILDHKIKGEDIINLVYLKEFSSEFTDNLSKVDKNSKVTDTISSHLRMNDKQIRENILTNLKSIFIDLIIALNNLDYNLKSSNVYDSRLSNFITTTYKLSSTTSQQMKKIKYSTINLNYNKNFNILILKFNHSTYKQSSITYPKEFKIKVNDVYNKLLHEKTLPGSNLSGLKLNYDSITGNLVYEKMHSVQDFFSHELQQFLKTLSKDKFIGDFIHFETKFQLNQQDIEEKQKNKRDDLNGIMEEDVKVDNSLVDQVVKEQKLYERADEYDDEELMSDVAFDDGVDGEEEEEDDEEEGEDDEEDEDDADEEDEDDNEAEKEEDYNEIEGNGKEESDRKRVKLNIILNGKKLSTYNGNTDNHLNSDHSTVKESTADILDPVLQS